MRGHARSTRRAASCRSRSCTSSGRTTRAFSSSSASDMPLTVGTAGHIDHGKTWLVRALTGKDTDRLPEEQRRGISIDLGYAPLELPDGRRLSVVDVPGHERFVRTMVAGATGIDLFLLVVDAGEGARPQTHEHLAILRLLGIERGVVAVTKVDAVDAETVALAVEEARELVAGRRGRPRQREDGRRARRASRGARRASPTASSRRGADRPTRLYVDRSFSLRRLRDRRHGHALVGLDRRRETSCGSSRPVVTCASAASRCTTATSSARSRASASRSAFPASSGARSDAARRSSRPARTDLVPARRRARRARADRGRRACPGARRDRARAGARRAARRALRAAAARAAGRRGARRPRDPARARRRSAAESSSTRCRRAIATRRGSLARGRGRRRDDRTRRSASTRCASSLDGELDGRRARRPVGLLARRGSRSSSASSGRVSTPPTRSIPGIPLPSEPWAADVLPLLAVRAARREALPAGRRRDARGPGRGRSRARGASSRAPACARRRWRTTSSRASSRRAGASCASGTATRSAPTRSRSRGTSLLTECRATGEITLARFRDLVGTGRRDAQLLLERFDADGLTRRVRRAPRAPTRRALRLTTTRARPRSRRRRRRASRS